MSREPERIVFGSICECGHAEVLHFHHQLSGALHCGECGCDYFRRRERPQIDPRDVFEHIESAPVLFVGALDTPVRFMSVFPKGGGISTVHETFQFDRFLCGLPRGMREEVDVTRVGAKLSDYDSACKRCLKRLEVRFGKDNV